MSIQKDVNSNIKQAVRRVVDQIQSILEQSDSSKNAQLVFNRFQDTLEQSSIEVRKPKSEYNLAEFNNIFNELCSDLNIQESYHSLVRILKDEFEELEKLNVGLNSDILSSFTQILLDTLSEDEEFFWEVKRQEYKQSAKDAIAQSLADLNISSFSAGNLEITPAQEDSTSPD